MTKFEKEDGSDLHELSLSSVPLMTEKKAAVLAIEKFGGSDSVIEKILKKLEKMIHAASESGEDNKTLEKMRLTIDEMTGVLESQASTGTGKPDDNAQKKMLDGLNLLKILNADAFDVMQGDWQELIGLVTTACGIEAKDAEFPGSGHTALQKLGLGFTAFY